MSGWSSSPLGERHKDTPVITKGDVSSKEKSEHEELLSRLWAHVYGLRGEILRVGRLKLSSYLLVISVAGEPAADCYARYSEPISNSPVRPAVFPEPPRLSYVLPV